MSGALLEWRLQAAHAAPWLAVVPALFREYAEWLGVDLGFQDFERELASLPGRYAPPGGCIIVAEAGRAALGCVAVRPLQPPGTCEMKRLWTRPAARGHGVGEALARAALAEARAAGHSVMRLDTLAHMKPALALYERLGFRRIEAYYHNPLPDAVYLERSLDEPEEAS